MASIIDSLPGVTLPISKISETLSNMWLMDTKPNVDAPSEFRASQMNLILHLGDKTPVEEGMMCFYTAILFAQNYPCRIIVLCPDTQDSDTPPLEGKLFTQCFIGEGLRDMCCCEAIIIGYHTNQLNFLENQISVWLENDLPTYYWFNRVPSERISKRYLDFAQHCTRIVFDSSIEKDAYDNIAWPSTSPCHDLAYSRILQIRQSIAQIMSSYAPAVIVKDLQQVRITYSEHLFGEARSLFKWIKCCLAECAGSNTMNIKFDFSVNKNEDKDCAIKMNFNYSNKKSLEWRLDNNAKKTTMISSVGDEKTESTMHVDFLNLEKALAEAIFFN